LLNTELKTQKNL